MSDDRDDLVARLRAFAAAGYRRLAAIGSNDAEALDVLHMTERSATEIERQATLFNAIAHGDAEHRAWLKEAIDAHFSGQPIPPLTGSGNKEKRIAELEAQVKACRGALEPFAKIKPSTFYPADGSENEGYRAYLHEGKEIEFTGRDLCRVREALRTLDEGVGSYGGVLAKRPVAFRVKDFADGWILFQSEEAANRESEATGALMQGLYVRDGSHGDDGSALCALKHLIGAIDAGSLQMSSPEIDLGDGQQPHPWHEEWLARARNIAASPVAPALTSEQGEKSKETE